MLKYRFRYETLLKVRRAKEREALMVLTEKRRGHQEMLEIKQYFLGELEKACSRRERLGIDPTTIAGFQVENDYIRGTQQRISQVDHKLVKTKRNVEKAMEVYSYARKQTRLTEVLYEKSLMAYRKEVSRREQKNADELVLQRRAARLGED